MSRTIIKYLIIKIKQDGILNALKELLFNLILNSRNKRNN